MLVAVAILAGIAPPEARAQELRIEVDQEAVTALLRRQIGKRWVLVHAHGKDRLVFDDPRVEILPRGIYLSGRLRSLTPELDLTVEILVRPHVRGATLRVDAETVTVVRPEGVMGYLPRMLLTRYLRSEGGRKELRRFALDLGPVMRAIGDPAKMAVRLRLGFGGLALALGVR